MAVVNGGENLTTVNAIPKILSSGTLTQGTLLLDETNHRIYFDGAYRTGVVAKAGQGVLIAGNDQFVDGLFVSSPNAGTVLAVLTSSAASGAVGGGAFNRSGGIGATIGMGYNTNGTATWDVDLLGTSSGIGFGYDLSVNNKNVAASLRLTAGTSIILGIAVGESAAESLRLDATGLVLQAATLLIQATSSVAAAGSTQGTAASITVSRTLVTGADGAKGVILPSPATGQTHEIINTVNTEELIIYPHSGGNINFHSADVGVKVGAGKITCIATSSTQWYCTQETML